jgi:Tol biopolymer transport system component
MIGSTLAHYRITGELGSGGMGEVWRAEDEKLGREVALKVLPADVAEDAERLARFEREAKVLASLNHPNIAHLYGLETDESGAGGGAGAGTTSDPQAQAPEAPATPSSPVTFLVMELVEGEDLSERISRGPIPIDEAIPIALQIAEALEAAHESGIVHRDLKPANVKIRPDGMVKVLDFGLAKAWESQKNDSSLSLSPTLTQHATVEGVILGTAAYMSPEQAAGAAVDRRADIWSFGVVLWEMLTGEALFGGDTVSHVLASVLKDSVDLDGLPGSMPPPIRRLLDRCLRRDARRRLQSIGDARVVLEEVLEDSGAEEIDPSSVAAVAPRPAWWLRALPWALVALLAIAFAITAMTRPTPRIVQTSVLAPPEGTIRPDHGLALSPDGRTVAFVADIDTTSQLWIRSLDDLSARPLIGTDDALLPFFSPDGRHLGFFADGKLKRIPVVGGAVRVLADALDPRGGTWGDNDLIVFSPDYRTGLSAVPASGGDVQRLTSPDEARYEKSHRWPSFLPGGSHLLFLAQTHEGGASNDQSTVEVLSLDDGVRVPVLQVNSSVAYDPRGAILYWRNGTLMAHPFDPDRLAVEDEPVQVADEVDYTQNERGVFAISSEGTLVYDRGQGMDQPARLEWLDRDGTVLSEAAPFGSYLHLSLAPDGRRFASTDGLTIWIRDLERGIDTRLTHDDRDHFSPVWSPDGAWLAYATNPDSGGGGEIRRMRASGLGEEELVATLEHQAVLKGWSPDGRFLAYEAVNPGTEWDCWIFNLETGTTRRVVGTKYTDRDPAFSPDGRWLAYFSTESGRSEIYVIPVDDLSAKWQVSTDGGRFPVWGASGEELFFADFDNRVMAVAVAMSDEPEIGRPRALFTMLEQPEPSGIFDFAGFAVGPDGNRFLLHRAQETEAISDSLILVQNWLEIAHGAVE